MKDLNRIRLAAGIGIDPSIEITDKSVAITESVTSGPMTDFCVVGTVDAESEIHDVLQFTNLRGLIKIIKSASAAELEQLQVFHHNDVAAAKKAARRAIKEVSSAVPAPAKPVEPVTESTADAACKDCRERQERDADFQAAWKLKSQSNTINDRQIADGYRQLAKFHLAKFNDKKDSIKCSNCSSGKVAEAVVVESQCRKCSELQSDDADYQAAWKLKMGAKNLARTQPSLAKSQMEAAKTHLAKFNAKKDSIKCDDCKAGTTTESVALEFSQLEEFVVGAKFTSWEEDEKSAVNVVAPTADPVTSDNTRATDKDESPSQLDEPGDLGSATDGQGYDADKKLNVPTKLKTQLKDEIKNAMSAADKLNYSNRDAAVFYKDLAAMFEDLLNHLEGGTVHDIKLAGIFMTSLMGPMLHKVPADVVNYIARGGQPASLKSYMKAV